MGLPFKPSELKAAVVVLPTDNLCTALKKTFIIFPIWWYRWYSWAYKSNGMISDEFKQLICVDCPETTT